MTLVTSECYRVSINFDRRSNFVHVPDQLVWVHGCDVVVGGAIEKGRKGVEIHEETMGFLAQGRLSTHDTITMAIIEGDLLAVIPKQVDVAGINFLTKGGTIVGIEPTGLLDDIQGGQITPAKNISNATREGVRSRMTNHRE